jgi:hypothetical protein
MYLSATENPGGFLLSRCKHGGVYNPEQNPPSNRRFLIENLNHCRRNIKKAQAWQERKKKN